MELLTIVGPITIPSRETFRSLERRNNRPRGSTPDWNRACFDPGQVSIESIRDGTRVSNHFYIGARFDVRFSHATPARTAKVGCTWRVGSRRVYVREKMRTVLNNIQRIQ